MELVKLSGFVFRRSSDCGAPLNIKDGIMWFQKHLKTALWHSLPLTLEKSGWKASWDFLAHLCRDSSCMSVGFTLFVVLSHLWPAHAADLSTSLGFSFCSRDPKSTNKTWDVRLSTAWVVFIFMFFFYLQLQITGSWNKAGFVKCQAWSLEKHKACVLLVRAGAPHWEAPNTYRWSSAHLSDHCRVDFLCSDPKPKLEKGENGQSSISTSLCQLGEPRFSAGSDESERPARNHFFYRASLFFFFVGLCQESMCLKLL